MKKQKPSAEASHDTTDRTPLWQDLELWRDLWLLSFFAPYAIWTLVLLFFGDVVISGYLTALLMGGPLALSILGMVSCLVTPQLSVEKRALYFFLTIFGHVIALPIYFFLLLMLFGVVAT